MHQQGQGPTSRRTRRERQLRCHCSQGRGRCSPILSRQSVRRQCTRRAVRTDNDPLQHAGGNKRVGLSYRSRRKGGVLVRHRGRPKHMTETEKPLLKRRQAVEPSTGQSEVDNRFRRDFLNGPGSDVMNPVLGTANYSDRRLMRWIVLFLALPVRASWDCPPRPDRKIVR